jgi:hypothetical protein
MPSDINTHCSGGTLDGRQVLVPIPAHCKSVAIYGEFLDWISFFMTSP